MKPYVINLERRTDRLQGVTSRFLSAGVSLRRFDAVDAVSLSNVDVEGLVPAGILACWLSHEALLEEVANGSEEVVVVLEDDAVPSPDVDWRLLLDRLPDAMANHELGFLQLGFVSWQFGLTRPGLLEKARSFLYPRSRAVLDLDYPRPAWLGSVLSGTHAYAVTSEFARKIRNVNSPCWTGADGLFMRLSSMSGADGRFPIMARLKASIVEQETRQGKAARLDSDVS